MSAADEIFAAERPRLLGLAYRILASYADAEDVVQETWIRWQAVEHDPIARPAAYLTTIATRLALDRARILARRREDYVGPWLPEPVAVQRGPEDHAELVESLTLGFLLVLDRLSPTERAVWLLADVFGEPYTDIASVVGKSEAACRQIATRARRRLREERPGPPQPLDPGLLRRLLAAVSAGDLEGTLELLDARAVLLSDGGPDHRAARHPVVGADRVARLAINLARRGGVSAVGEAVVNGEAALVVELEGAMTLVLTGEQHDGRITCIYLLLNPEKLRGIFAHPAMT
ncbi:RNA polymerase sigma factor SigJ [Aciditerrimonas ferrireducens]|uniref:RNA polymerase sigma factor SigJ n=1 Tax=Aciditerrimonas ferrireducens TaxID=667306 RepID=UPI0020048326|nr:RNA polymerase sigma factor SigJ [Aciditerrimonas ferrireducens]MCK4178012.1 RNA polymerase sigma factor SigJ [Aciditerrimonas ferrireducens]